MEPFNLKNERTEGFFDETGNYVWRKEEGGADPWLASLENEEDLEARIAAAQGEEQRLLAELAKTRATLAADESKMRRLQKVHGTNVDLLRRKTLRWKDKLADTNRCVKRGRHGGVFVWKRALLPDALTDAMCALTELLASTHPTPTFPRPHPASSPRCSRGCTCWRT